MRNALYIYRCCNCVKKMRVAFKRLAFVTQPNRQLRSRILVLYMCLSIVFNMFNAFLSIPVLHSACSFQFLSVIDYLQVLSNLVKTSKLY